MPWSTIFGRKSSFLHSKRVLQWNCGSGTTILSRTGRIRDVSISKIFGFLIIFRLFPVFRWWSTVAMKPDHEGWMIMKHRFRLEKSVRRPKRLPGARRNSQSAGNSSNPDIRISKVRDRFLTDLGNPVLNFSYRLTCGCEVWKNELRCEMKLNKKPYGWLGPVT